MIETGTLLQSRYRVVRQIGQGGMGAVYLATDERFRSTVAIKQTLFDDATLCKAFEREAHLLNRLRHAALPKVSDHFSEGAGQYLVMEFIEGLDFSELLHERNGAFPLANVLQWADDLLDALEYLHTQDPPVIHRDIKPQNLKLTTRGKVVLLDFGLAKGAQAQTRASVSDSIFGYSRNYAPLEQIQGTGTDARSDLYSLGATLYHLLTGSTPVDAVTRAAALVNNQPDPLQPAHLAHAQVPESVSKIIHRAMARNRERRPATAAELRAQLRKVSTDVSPHVARLTSAAELLTQGGHPSNDATILESLTAAVDDRRVAAPASVLRSHQVPTVQRETTLVDGAYAPRRGATTYVGEVSSTTPGRLPGKSRQLLIGAVIGLVVLSASIPVILSRRSDATGVNEGPQITTPASAPVEAQQTDASGGAEPNSAVGTATSGPAVQPAASPTEGQTAGTVEPTTNAPRPETGSASNDAGANASHGNPGGQGFNHSTPSSGGRSTLVINEPAPHHPAGNNKTGYEEELRQAEETRKEQARRAEEARNEQMRREEARRPPPGFFPPPPPPGGHPPPPRPRPKR